MSPGEGRTGAGLAPLRCSQCPESKAEGRVAVTQEGNLFQRGRRGHAEAWHDLQVLKTQLGFHVREI